MKIVCTYEVKIFCDEFYRIYNFETDKTQLIEKEKSEFEELFCMVARFTEFEEDLKIPNVYFSKEELLAKAKEVQAFFKKLVNIPLFFAS